MTCALDPEKSQYIPLIFLQDVDLLKKKISIITPCFNEEENVALCVDAVREIFSRELSDFEYEHIFSDNASTDKTFEILRNLALNDKHIKVIRNSRNVGPFLNMWNGIRRASGDAVIPLLPADLQDPVHVIPLFIEKWLLGYHVVFGIRKQREEGVFLRLMRSIYYWIIHRFASTFVPRNAGEFLLADRKVIDVMLLNDNYYPYIRGLIAHTTSNFTSVTYTWVRRKKGRSKNDFLKLLDQAINGLISTSRIPARFALFGGLFISFFGILYGILNMFLFIFTDVSVSRGIPTIIVGTLLLGGIQLFFLGLIGEYVLSIHSQVRRVPTMFEVETINFQKQS